MWNNLQVVIKKIQYCLKFGKKSQFDGTKIILYFKLSALISISPTVYCDWMWLAKIIE